MICPIATEYQETKMLFRNILRCNVRMLKRKQITKPRLPTIDEVADELQSISLNESQESKMIKAIKENDKFASLYCISHANLPAPREVLFTLGAHGKPQMYHLIRNSNCYENDFSDNFRMTINIIFEGIAFTDNSSLLYTLTQSHQLNKLDMAEAKSFILAMRDHCAYKSMSMFIHFISNHSHFCIGERDVLKRMSLSVYTT